MLIALLAAATSSPVGEGLFVGVHGGAMRVQMKKVFEDAGKKEEFEAKKAHDNSLKSPESVRTSVNGIVGVHVGYAKRLHKDADFGAGGLLELHRMVGKDLIDLKKDAEFGANILGQLRYFAVSHFYLGAESGFAVQQVRTSMETRWPITPLLGCFFGVGVGHSQKVVCTGNLRYGFPIKQSAEAGISPKPSSLAGTVSMSYYFNK